MPTLKKFRRTPAFTEELPYGSLIDEGIILLKNGALLAGFFFRGQDTESATQEELAILSLQTNAILNRLGQGWMLQVDALRIQSNDYPELVENSFPTLASRLIEEERRIQFKTEGLHFENKYVLLLTWLPPLAIQDDLVNILFTDSDNKMSVSTFIKRLTGKKTDQTIQDKSLKLLDRFKRAIQDVEHSLNTNFHIRRMQSVKDEQLNLIQDELLSYVGACITGEVFPANVPPVPMHLDWYLTSDYFFTGVAPRIGNKYIKCIVIDDFPSETMPTILDQLNDLPLEYRVNSRFIFMDQQEAINEINKHRKKWRQKVRGFVDQMFNTNRSAVNVDALQMAEETEAAMGLANSGQISYGLYTCTVVLLHEDEELLEDQAKEVRKLIRNLGFSARIETINAPDAYIGSLPGESFANVRRFIINTLNLAHLLPLTSVWPGLEYNPSPFYPPFSPPLLHGVTVGSTPFRLNLHVSDVGHTLILGPTGAGKSTLLAMIASQFQRYDQSQIFIFDKDYSCLPLVLGDNGNFYNIGEDSEFNFAPLSRLETHEDIAWAEEWVENLLSLSNFTVTHIERNLIHEAMMRLSKNAEFGRSLTHFVQELQDTKMREALNYYTIDGTVGKLLDAESDNITLSHLQCFEMSTLLNMGEKIVLPVLSYLFRVIERQLAGSPSLLIVDEGWVMLDHPVFREKLKDWFKTFRRKNCAVIFATQEIHDIIDSPIMETLLASTPTKIFLPNPEAKHEMGAAFYKKLGLNDKQVQLIYTSMKKRDYYYVSENGKRMFGLGLGNVALAFCGASGKENLTKIQALYKDYGNAWIYEWLKERNLPDWIDYAKRLEEKGEVR